MAKFEIYSLKVNFMVNPVGIDTVPFFSWKMKSAKAGVFQSAYRIEVKKFDLINGAEAETVWDSGKTDGDISVKRKGTFGREVHFRTR
ncbi:MAG: hypothetical protein MJ177_00605 [Clostridia bacterium]|nr:hypothetical protein [Clostridia bacterium]